VTVAGEGHDFGCLGHRRWIRRVGSFDIRSECECMLCELSESRGSSRVAVRFDGGRERVCCRYWDIAGSSELYRNQQGQL
jgi:hypothetical protein